MPRPPRVHTRPGAPVELVNRAIHGRGLIRPGPRLNALLVGALAKAQKNRSVEIYGGACMSSHFHLILGGCTVEEQADFMRDFTRRLSVESGLLYDWPSTTFPRRYRQTEISLEPEAQIARLRYCLANGCKEGLVGSPLDWPGVAFAEALISEEPLRGIWIDRTGFSRALKRGEDVTLEDFTESVELRLTPLPCWKELDRETRRGHVLAMVRDIEEETALRHREEGTVPLGASAVTVRDPHERPAELESSPKPYVHAFSRNVREEMREALRLIVAAYRAAAACWRQGDFGVMFPENTFRPAGPFVPGAFVKGALLSGAMGLPRPEVLKPG